MKVKKVFITFFVAFICCVFVLGLSVGSFAALEGANLNRQFNDDATPTEVNNLIDNSAGNLIAIMRIIGVSASLTILAIIAARYMLAAPSEKADLKKQTVAFTIGAFLLFAATTLIGIVVDLANTIHT